MFVQLTQQLIMIKNLQIAVLFYVLFVTNTVSTMYVNKTSATMTDYTQSAIITSLLNNAKNLLDDAKSYADLETSCSMPIDCAAILEANPSTRNGIYRIWPRSRVIEGFIEVYCDMDDENGGWTVIQRRGDFDSGKDYFYKKWDAYKRGFGDLNKDFWLGNDKIHALTNQRMSRVKFVLSDFEGNTTCATYDDFWIEDEIRNYTLHVSGYRGTAGDSFSYHDGAQFSTKDRDNDEYSSEHCAIEFSGSWWFKTCLHSHLNGLYLKETDKVDSFQGLNWRKFSGFNYSLKDTVIKIRPRDYRRKGLDVPTPH